jgi:UDP-N-acetyl-2-amino-2-deoxyglucuronate dehydrogenase
MAGRRCLNFDDFQESGRTPGGVKERGLKVPGMSNSLNHAIVGCGRIAPSHADAFSQIAQVRLLTYCDPDPTKSDALAKRFAVDSMVADFAEVLSNPEIDSVSLCVPHHLHAAYTRMALEAGKHVLVEKPFSISPAEAAASALLAKEKGLILQPVCQHRFDKAVQHVREILRDELGDVCMVRAHLECHREKVYYSESDWRGKWETEGGSVLINQAYHVVDLLLWLMGPVKSLAAQMDTLTGSDVMETEDVLTAQLKFEGRALGSLTVNGACGAQWHSYIEVCGTKGVVGFDIGYPNQVPRLRLKSRRALKNWRKAFAELLKSAPLPTAALDYYGDSHRREAEAFVAQIEGTSSEYASTPEQAVEVVKTVAALYEAARGEQWVNLC